MNASNNNKFESYFADENEDKNDSDTSNMDDNISDESDLNKFAH